MLKPGMNFYSREDILYISIAEGKEASSKQLDSGITAELNEDGELIGIEILNASKFLENFILTQAGLNDLKIAS